MTVQQLAAAWNLTSTCKPHPNDSRPKSRASLRRRQTERWLRHYGEFASGAGRLASVRCGVTYRADSLDTTVIDTVDLERCLQLLQPAQTQLLLDIYTAGMSSSEAARAQGCRSTPARQLREEALDALTAILVKRRLLS